MGADIPAGASAGSPTDEELLAAARQGDAAALETLHRARVAVRQELAPVLGRPAIESPRGATCPDVLTLFSQHLEGEIDPSVCATMEAHLAQCNDCRHACESLKRTLGMCRQLPTPDVPASLASSIKAAIRAVLAQP